MALYKPKPPPKNKKKKLGEFTQTKKTAKPKKLPRGPKQLTEHKQTKTVNGKKTDDKKKSPNWRDSTYMKQESYLKKLLADFNAKQIRSKADLAVYYGNEERAAQGEVRSADTTRKELIKDAPAKKAPAKKAPVKTQGVKAGDDVAYKSKKPANKGKITEHVVTSSNKPKLVDAGKKPKLTEHKVTKTVTKAKKPQYRNVVVKGKVIRQAIAGSKA